MVSTRLSPIDRRASLPRDLVESSDHPRCDRSGSAISNCSTIRLDYWNELGSGTGEKTFVRDKHVVTGDIGFGNAQAHFGGELERDSAGDAAQRSGADGRGKNLPVLDHK